MGIVNVTPDSFSDGGEYLRPKHAVERAQGLIEEGADIIDIGGESTRPGKKEPISVQEEQDRILPVLEGVLRACPGATISIDTYRHETARLAVKAGAEIVNDISGFTWDESMASVCAELQCACVLTHVRGRPENWWSLPALSPGEIVPMIREGLRHCVEKALAAGISHSRLVLDPGFGFGKSFDENYPILAHLDSLHNLGLPLLSGTSRKSFLGKTIGRRSSHGALVPAPADQRLYGTVASVVVSVLKGAHIVRVHDVKPALEAVAIADAVLNAGS